MLRRFPISSAITFVLLGASCGSAGNTAPASSIPDMAATALTQTATASAARPIPTITPIPPSAVFGGLLAVASTPVPQAAPTRWFVGVDIQPGTYQTRNSNGACHWERDRGVSGSRSDIIDSGTLNGPGIVRIEPTDMAFTFLGCGTWTAVPKTQGSITIVAAPNVCWHGLDEAPVASALVSGLINGCGSGAYSASLDPSDHLRVSVGPDYQHVGTVTVTANCGATPVTQTVASFTNFATAECNAPAPR